MKLSVLSGKGGTGKTTLSVNLYAYLKNATLIDTDTEEPNSHLFINPQNDQTIDVLKQYPVVDYTICNHCKKCGEYCNFNAIIPTNKKVLVFDDLCHDCGLCAMVCETNAIQYKDKHIGSIYSSFEDDKAFHYGKLNVGEISGVRIIEKLTEIAKDDDLVIVDCPPGVACSTVAASRDSDYAIICAEPTPFGISDMKMVVELLREEGTPFGVVVNKSGIGNQDIYHYLEHEKITLLENIPFTKKRAMLYSEGKLIVDYDFEFRDKIKNIINQVLGDINDQ